MAKLEQLRQAQAKTSTQTLKSIESIQAEHVAIMARAEHQSTWFNRFFLLLGAATLVLALAALVATVAYPNGVTWVVDHAPGAVRTDGPPP